MIWKPLLQFLGSQLFANLILVISIIVVFAVGYRQILINDVVEIYVTVGLRPNLDLENKPLSYTPVLFVQNIGTRLVYLDKYIFNGREYKTNGQILPPTYSQAKDPFYWIELPINAESHVSLTLYYHDLDSRNWKSDVIADLSNNVWKVSSLPRTEQK